MAKRKKKSPSLAAVPDQAEYESVLGEISELLDAARKGVARSVNVIMTLTYWEIG